MSLFINGDSAHLTKHEKLFTEIEEILKKRVPGLKQIREIHIYVEKKVEEGKHDLPIGHIMLSNDVSQEHPCINCQDLANDFNPRTCRNCQVLQEFFKTKRKNI